MKDKKKILFVINSLRCGGAEKSLVSLLSLIDYERYSVDLQMFNSNGMFLELLPKSVNVLPELAFFEFLKKNVYQQLRDRNKRFIKTRVNLFFAFRRTHKNKNLHDAQVFWKICEKDIDKYARKYDVAIAWGQGNPTHYVADKVVANAKYAWINADYEAVGHNRHFDKRYYDKYDKIVAVSKTLEKIVKSTFPDYTEKVVTIQDIQNQELIIKMSKFKADIWKKENRWRLVTVGRLVKAKGYDIAIEACKVLEEYGMNFEWIIIGDGPEKEWIKNKISEYKLGQNMFLLGAKSNPYSYMKTADIYVQTSRNEGYCLTLAEARILNIPCVTTDFEVVYSQITNGVNGLIVEKDGKALALAIKKMMENSELREKIVQNLKNEKKGNIEEIIHINELLQG